MKRWWPVDVLDEDGMLQHPIVEVDGHFYFIWLSLVVLTGAFYGPMVHWGTGRELMIGSNGT